jgi:hypothetical protein
MRKFLAAVIGAWALVVSSVLVAPAAHAKWTDVGGSLDFRICKKSVDDGRFWRIRARVGKPDGIEDARGGIELYRRDLLRDRWRSGWLADDQVRRGRARVHKARSVRVVAWEEAGDLDSPVGTALQTRVFKPRRIRHC